MGLRKERSECFVSTSSPSPGQSVVRTPPGSLEGDPSQNSESWGDPAHWESGRVIWMQRLFAFSRPSHSSGAAALPGAELFLRIPTFFLEQATCPGQLRCLGQMCFLRIPTFFEQATCPGQLRCLGQNFFLRNVFLNNPVVPGNFAAWGRVVS